MKNTVEFLNEAAEVCFNLWDYGWGEFHAGNLTYLLSKEEVAEISPLFSKNPVFIPLDFNTSGLVGEFFLVSRAGGSFRTIVNRMEKDLGVVSIQEDGYTIHWGFENGTGKATSEFPAHLLAHAARLKVNKHNKIILHCHPTYTTAMTSVHSLDEKEFTKTLWKLGTECPIVFPEGVGILPWMICGNEEIAIETAKKMTDKKIVIWPHHGVFASGNSLGDALGLIETVEKNAQIYILINGNIQNEISDNQIEALAKAFDLW